MNIEPYPYDEELLQGVQEQGSPAVRVYQLPTTAIVLGRSSKAEVELDLAACLEDDVPLFRRRGGGCAVVVDPGNIIVSTALVTRGLGNITNLFARLSAWLLKGLAQAGIYGLRQEIFSDLVQGDRKIAGACMYLSGNLLYYSATLLVAPRLDLMDRYLRHPPREPAYRRGRRHTDFVGALHRPGSPDLPTLLSHLRLTLTAPTIDPS